MFELFFRRCHGINRAPVHDDSVIATTSAGPGFNSVSRNADASDQTTLDAVVAEAALPMTNKLSCRTGDSLMQWLSSPVVWSLIILILSSVGILREIL